MSLTIQIIENFNYKITSNSNKQKPVKCLTIAISEKLNEFIFDFDHYMFTRSILEQMNLVTGHPHKK